MKSDIFEYFTTDNISGIKTKKKWLELNDNKLYLDIENWCNQYEQLKDIEFKRKVYHYINEDSVIPLCPVCNNILKFIRVRDGYRTYCSEICVKKSIDYKSKWLETWKANNSNNEFLSKVEKTGIKNYGSIENFKKEKLKRVIKTNNEKYGVDFYLQTTEFKKDRSKKLKDTYGDENWNNKEKTRKTRITNKTQIDDVDIESFLNYKKITVNRTVTIYRNNIEYINPLKLERGKKSYHIDHKYSVKQGFLNNIPIEIISHPCNLFMIWYMDNLVKQDRCDITIEMLIENIKNYDNDVIIKHSSLNNLYKKENLLNTIKKLNL